jgi:hypothetical protein
MNSDLRYIIELKIAGIKEKSRRSADRIGEDKW